MGLEVSFLGLREADDPRAGGDDAGADGAVDRWHTRAPRPGALTLLRLAGRVAEHRLADREREAVCSWALLPAEKRAVIDYALDHPKDGYRRLAWQMVDADVAYLSPSSVYRVLSDEDLRRPSRADPTSAGTPTSCTCGWLTYGTSCHGAACLQPLRGALGSVELDDGPGCAAGGPGGGRAQRREAPDR